MLSVALVLGGGLLATAPTAAAACEPDVVCDTAQDAKCVPREGTRFLPECYGIIGP